MLTDDERTKLLNLLVAWEELTGDRQTADLDGEPEIVRKMMAVNTRINVLCPPVTDTLPWAFTPLDTARPDLEAEGGIQYRTGPE
jgi:hypothetical protein